MNEFGKSGIINRLKQLDDDLLSLIEVNIQVEMTIVGGSALVLLGLCSDTRVTTDIDVMEVTSQIETLLARHNMNQDVTTFRFRLPEHWKSRRQRIPFTGSILQVCAPSNEDLAILKLDAYRDVDKVDLIDMLENNKLDIEQMQAIIDNDVELRINFDNEDEWQVFIEKFHSLKQLSLAREERNETS